MRNKIIEFVRLHGYTYKSFLLSMVLFPPAAAFIGFNKPGLGLVPRVVLATLGLLTLPGLTTFGGYLATQLVRLHALH
jgi:hypothetical protein